MQIKLEYGKTGYMLTLPDEYQVDVLSKPPMPVVENAASCLQSSFDKPVNCESFETIAENKNSVCIAICDITRPVPNGLILPTLIKRLLACGIEQKNITIIIATGFHDPNENQVLREVIGDDWVFNNIRIVNHFARNEEDHSDLGCTTGGTHALIDRRFVEADLKFVIGLVEPHFMAGYSGGRKLIVPGIAHAKTISRVHSDLFLGNEKARNCNLQGNPLHEEQLEIAEMIPAVYAINVVLDDKRNIGFINFGDLVESHLEAIKFLQKYAEIEIEQKYLTVITSAAGYPLDSSFYQTVKAMTGAMGAVEQGGSMFVASSCANGFGSKEYFTAQQKLLKLGVDGFLSEIGKKEFADIDEWQTEMQIRAMKTCKINLFTNGLSNSEKNLTGINVLTDFEETIIKWVESCGDKKVAVIPEGPYVIPHYKRANYVK